MREKKPDTRDVYTALGADPEDMTAEDVESELSGAEDQAAALRASLAEAARNLGADLRRNGIAAPPVLKDVADTLTDTTALPRDEKLFRTRASNRLADLERRKAVPSTVELLEAARKGPGELSPEDRALLDAEAEEFRNDLNEEHDETK